MDEFSEGFAKIAFWYRKRSSCCLDAGHL